MHSRGLQAVTFPRLIPSAAPASLSLMATYEELAIISVLFWNTSLLSLNIIIYWALTLYQKLDRTLYATNLISASPQPHKFHVTISFYHWKTGICWWLSHIWTQILPHSHTHCEFPTLSLSLPLPNSKKRKLWGVSWCWHGFPCTAPIMFISCQKGEIVNFILFEKQDKTVSPPHYSSIRGIPWMSVHIVFIYRFIQFCHQWDLRGVLIKLPFFEIWKTREESCSDTPGSSNWLVAEAGLELRSSVLWLGCSTL